jgi:glycosyltransferase involved in cell wall biosynthesis
MNRPDADGMRTKFVIVDPGLNRLGGHNFTLALSFSDAAHALGHDVLWLCHKEFPSDLVPSHIRAERVFSLSYYKKSRLRWHVVRAYDRLADRFGDDPAGQSASGRSVRGLAWLTRPFVKEMAAAIRRFEIGPADHVFLTTAEYLQFAALAELLSTEGRDVLPFFHVRTSFDEHAHLNTRFGYRLPQVFRRLRDLNVVGRRVFLYAETAALAAHLESWNLVPFEVLGNPVPKGFLKVSARSDAGDARRPLTIVFPGQARAEKGYVRLPAIVAGLQARDDVTRPVRFVLQSSFGRYDTGGSVRRRDRDRGAAREALRAFPDSLVQVVDRALTNEEYFALIADADVLLLPYDAEVYRTRPSMIVSEAALFGKPVVVTAGTTLAELAEPGIGETASTDADFVDGLTKVINDYDAYRAKAEARATTLRRDLDARVLVQRMLERTKVEPAYACAG